MRRTIAALVTFLVLVIPARVFAKGDTVKITITGAGLQAPIEITDPKVLTNFQVWTGLGTGSDAPGFNPNTPGFIIDWSKGATTEPPRKFPRYEVSFYAKLPNERLIYVVCYEYDPLTKQGYVYLPGKADRDYWLNVGTIFRHVEGSWFPAWSKWDDVARPFTEDTRRTLLS